MAGFYDEITAADGTFKCFIDGAWRASTSGKTVRIANPCTEETAFQVQGEDRRGIGGLRGVWEGGAGAGLAGRPPRGAAPLRARFHPARRACDRHQSRRVAGR